MTENNFIPHTPLGKRLLDLRTKAVDAGMQLISEEEVLERMEADEMASDVHIVRCIRCSGELEYNRTYDDDGDLWIDVVQCPKCEEADYNQGYEDGWKEGYAAGREECE